MRPMEATEGNRQAVATKEKAVKIRRRRKREKLRTNAIVNGTLVVQFASASEELHKRFSDGVTIRSRVSRAVRRMGEQKARALASKIAFRIK